MKFDYLFQDTTAYKPYDFNTLQTEPLGGTEATVVRVAQALGDLGYTVAVVQQAIENPVQYGNVYYLPISQLSNLDTKVFVMLRGIANAHLFPGAKKYSWLHDLPQERIRSWVPTLIANRVKVICVSHWHKQRCKEVLDNPQVKVTHIYNPVEDRLFIPKQVEVPHIPNKLVWLASPHKGLDNALKLFKDLQVKLPDAELELTIYNPGYLAHKSEQQRGVTYAGARSCNAVWKDIFGAMCVFYPCQFEETFGLIAAEANALRIPILSYAHGALPEVVSDKQQLVTYNDTNSLLNKAVSWYNGNRPNTYGQSKFKLSYVVTKWQSLLPENKNKNPKYRPAPHE